MGYDSQQLANTPAVDAGGTIPVMLAPRNAGYPQHRSIQPSYVPPGLAGSQRQEEAAKG